MTCLKLKGTSEEEERVNKEQKEGNEQAEAQANASE